MSGAPAEQWSREGVRMSWAAGTSGAVEQSGCEEELSGLLERQRVTSGKDEVPVDASEGCRAGGTQVVQGVWTLSQQPPGATLQPGFLEEASHGSLGCSEAPRAIASCVQLALRVPPGGVLLSY